MEGARRKPEGQEWGDRAKQGFRDSIRLWPYRDPDGRVVVVWMMKEQMEIDREWLTHFLPFFDAQGRPTYL